MRNMKIILALVVVLAVAVSGCLVSGTYPIVENVNFSFTADNGFYWYPIDLNSNSDWEDHQSELDDIEAIGFEFDLENTTDASCKFSVMFKAEKGPADVNNPPATIDVADYTLVIDALEVGAGATRHVSYAESLGMIQNQVTLKQIIMSGRFDYVGTSCGGTGDAEFHVTNGKIIITVAASDSST